MSVLKEVRKYMLSTYGNLISTDEPIFDEVEKIWKVQLKSDYPRIIRDDIDPERRMLKFITLKGLGEIQLSEDLKVIDATSREQCVNRLGSFLQMWRKRAERIIVTVSSYQFAKVSGARWMLNPILVIVSNLLQNELIEDWKIDADYRPDNIRQYLMMLEELKLVERREDGWSYGNLFTALREKSTDNREFELTILSHVIKERYSTIREIFDIRRFEPFVHLDACYYAPSLEAEELLFREEESIYFDYSKRHGRLPPLRVKHMLNELVEVKALQRRKRYYYGNEELFDEMLEMKSQLDEIASPRAG